MKLNLTTLAIAMHVLANAQTPTGTAPPATIFPPNLPTVPPLLVLSPLLFGRFYVRWKP